MSLVHNEKIKLLAATFNNLGIATVVSGFVAPMVTFVYGSQPPMPYPNLVAIAAIWLSMGFLLIVAARHVLEGLLE